uniref:WD_REPEATS_REGION domain-containing protein n=1 Tax=Rhabditophanes sp. KR3021 TaxID=114890 RepID=A0AC35TMC9_9BILA
MAQFRFQYPISCAAINPKDSSQLAFGLINGCFEVMSLDNKQNKLESIHSYEVEGNLRDIAYTPDGKKIVVTTADGAIGILDTVSLQVQNWLEQKLDGQPTALITLGGDRGIQTVVGDENGVIKMFDHRTSEEAVLTFTDQKDTITDLKFANGNVLAACADGTLCSYDLRKKRLGTKSEQSEYEYLAVHVGNKLTYVAGSCGIIDIYKNGEYGYRLERFDMKMKYGIDGMVGLNESVLLCASLSESYMRFGNVNPNKVLMKLDTPVEAGKLLVDGENKFVLAYGMSEDFVVYPIKDLISRVPIFNRENIKDAKRLLNDDKANGFFADMMPDKFEEHVDPDMSGSENEGEE